MRWPPECFAFFLTLSLTFFSPIGATPAQTVTRTPPPKASIPKASIPKASTLPVTLPDYGGRESPPATVPAFDELPSPDEALPSLNPAAQIGRALGALALVLALVFGVLFALKKFGLASGGAAFPFPVKRAPVKPSAKTSSPPDLPILLRDSQPLPGTPGAFVHLLTIADRTLLVGVTAQQITVLTELETRKHEEIKEKIGENGDEKDDDRAFEAYLKRQEMTTPPAIVIQTARTRVGQAAARLSALAKESEAR